MAVTIVVPTGGFGDDKGILSQDVIGVGSKQIMYSAAAGSFQLYSGGAHANQTGPTAGVHRLAVWWTAAGSATIYDDNVVTGTAVTGTIATNLQVGGYAQGTGQAAGGIYKNLCSDITSTVCR